MILIPRPHYFIQFGSSKNGENISLRKISDEDWAKLLNEVKCVILNKTSNKYFDAFLLSESSLFVFDKKLILKTCGTTTLLKSIPMLLEYSKRIGLDLINDFFYSRKNFDIPQNQLYPHYDFNTEIQYLDKVMRKIYISFFFIIHSNDFSISEQKYCFSFIIKDKILLILLSFFL